MAEDPRVRRWLRVAQFAHESDHARELRIAIVLLAEDPSDQAARERLRQLATGCWEQLAFFLAAEVRLTRDPTVVAALQQELTHAHAQVDKPTETIPELHAIIDREPGNADAFERLARFYYLAGAWAKTAETLEQLAAVSFDDLGLAALRAAGQLYRDHGRPDRALVAYRTIGIRRPGDREAMVALAELLNDPDLPPAPAAIEDAPIRPDTTLGAIDDGAHLTLDEIDDAELESGMAGLFGHTPLPMASVPGEPRLSTRTAPRIAVETVEDVGELTLDEVPLIDDDLVEAVDDRPSRGNGTAAPDPRALEESELRFEEQRLRHKLKSRPNDLLTHLALVELLCDSQRIPEAVDHLRATIGKSRGNDAQLWSKLGDVERLRNKRHAALTAYRRTLMIAPNSAGAVDAQRGLVELATQEHGGLHALVAKEQHPADVLCLARELAANHDTLGAHLAFDLARALGMELGHLGDAPHPPRAMAPTEMYAGALDLVEQRALVDDPDEEPLRGLLELFGEALEVLAPPPDEALRRARIRDARPVAAEDVLGTLFACVAEALSGPLPRVFASEDESHADPLVLLARPAVVVVGPHLLSLAQRCARGDLSADAALRFDLGRAIELARPHRIIAVGTLPDAFTNIVTALVAAFGRPAPIDPTLESLVARLRMELPPPLRERLVTYVSAQDPARFEPESYRLACERAADRAGLLACGAVGPAIGIAGGAEQAPHLVRLAARPEFLAAERRLRGGASA